jgi:Tfp pilus assembly protein PilP
MNKISLFVLLGILAISLESCSSFGSKSGEDTTSNNPTNSSATNSQSETANNTPPTSTESANSAESPDKVGISGLIPATNSDVRVSGSIRGRQDPFALITLKPEIKTKETEENQTRSLPKPKSFKPNPSNIESTPTIESLENQPVGTLAQNVIVSGLVELGGTTKLIIQAPEEATSRHVNVGQYISNGKILVKRILLDNLSTPRVVLEENGIEITKAIGEKSPAESSTQQETQAMNPTSENVLGGSVSWVSDYLSKKTELSLSN